MKNKSDHEEARETLWREVLIAATRSESSLDPKSCINWADHALAAFDERFSPEAHQERGEMFKEEAAKQKAKEAKAK